MAIDLESIKQVLQEGLRLSQQGSYHRRAPSPPAVPLLGEAQRHLQLWIHENGDRVDVLRLLALSEEALLMYERAVRTLEKVIKLSPRPDRKDLKRLAACRQASDIWSTLGLTPDELVALGLFLKEKLFDAPPSRSLHWTELWLAENKAREKEAMLDSIRKLGHFSDYEVLHNLVPG
jgi:tetratricopeptide (TPR) repeat protein